MRSDKQLDSSIREARAWESDPVTGHREVNRYNLPRLEKGRMSLSGNERNHLFLNHRGAGFADISGISGVDSPKDSRSFAIWDYDRDGWPDIALLNVNTPVLSLYRNRIGSLDPRARDRGQMFALRFVGGNATAKPSEDYGPRDGYGARVTVTLPDKTLTREHRCGEGLAAQNTSTMLIGIGPHRTVDAIDIQWPSGKSQRLENASAGELVTVYEDAAKSPDGSGFERTRYLVEPALPRPAPKQPTGLAGLRFSRAAGQAAEPGQTATLHMYTSMATWCVACREHLPELRRIRAHFDTTQVNMLGVPVDERDTEEKLNRFIADCSPAYVLDSNWEQAARTRFNRIITDQLGSEVLPATIITGSAGDVLAVFAGVPTVSDIARLRSAE